MFKEYSKRHRRHDTEFAAPLKIRVRDIHYIMGSPGVDKRALDDMMLLFAWNLLIKDSGKDTFDRFVYGDARDALNRIEFLGEQVFTDEYADDDRALKDTLRKYLGIRQ